MTDIVSPTVYVVHHDDYENQRPIAAYTDPDRAAELAEHLGFTDGYDSVGVTAVPLDGDWGTRDVYVVCDGVTIRDDGTPPVWFVQHSSHTNTVVLIGERRADGLAHESVYLDRDGFRQLPAAPAVSGHHDVSGVPVHGTTAKARASALTLDRAHELAAERLCLAFGLAGTPVEPPPARWYQWPGDEPEPEPWTPPYASHDPKVCNSWNGWYSHPVDGASMLCPGWPHEPHELDPVAESARRASLPVSSDCPNASAAGRSDRCGLFSFPARCTPGNCGMTP
jgi:hypothetical protein